MPFETRQYKRKYCITHHLKFSGVLSFDDFQSFKIYFNKILEGDKFCALFDMRDVTSVPTNLMWEQVKYMKEYTEQAKIKLVASAIILSSPWMKNLLDGFLKLVTLCAPNLIVTDLNDGQEFVDDNAFIVRKSLKP